MLATHYRLYHAWKLHVLLHWQIDLAYLQHYICLSNVLTTGHWRYLLIVFALFESFDEIPQLLCLFTCNLFNKNRL